MSGHFCTIARKHTDNAQHVPTTATLAHAEGPYRDLFMIAACPRMLWQTDNCRRYPIAPLTRCVCLVLSNLVVATIAPVTTA